MYFGTPTKYQTPNTQTNQDGDDWDSPDVSTRGQKRRTHGSTRGPYTRRVKTTERVRVEKGDRGFVPTGPVTPLRQTYIIPGP